MKRKSITLVELLVSMGIIASILAISMTSMNTIDRRQLESEARMLVADLSWTKESAISQHEHRGINFDATNKRYSIYRSPNGAAADFVQTNLLKRVALKSSLTLANANLWIYAPKGTTYNGGGGDFTVTLSLTGGRTRTVTVFKDTGFVKAD
ncbi:MAG: hypothetical protein PHE58_01640 [Candidatus Omnitrophica bacterium]|nr:hypothetical protein [Candidatus Omnitrophota bacterium]